VVVVVAKHQAAEAGMNPAVAAVLIVLNVVAIALFLRVLRRKKGRN